MAGGAVIGALRVVIGADSAALVSDLDRARGSLSSFGADMAKVGVAIGIAMTAAYAAVSLGVSNTISQMSDLAKQSQKIGIPVEQLSAMKLAADESGVGMEQLTKGVAKLSKAMVEAAAKPTSEAANAFKALGVSVTDTSGKLKQPNDVMLEMAGRFEGLKDGAGKTAVSMALMGKTGFELIPMLNMGSEGLAGMMERAKQLGITFDTDTANAAKKFQNTLTELGAAKDGIIVKLTAYMLPALQQFANRMLEAATSTEKQQGKLTVLKLAFDILARAVILVADNFSVLLKLGALFIGAQIAAAVITMALAFSKLALSVYMTGVAMSIFNAVRKMSLAGILLIVGGIALLTGQFDEMAATIKGMGAKIESMLPEGATDSIKEMLGGLGINLRALDVDLNNFSTTSEKAVKPLNEFKYAAMGGKNAVDSFIESTKKSLAAQNAETLADGMAAGAKERLRVTMQAYQAASAASLPVTEAMRAKIYQLGLEAEQTALKLRGQQLVQENMSPAEKFQQDMANNTLAMNAFGASAERIARMQQNLAEQAGTAWNVAGASIAGSFADIAGAFGKENSKMALAAKIFGTIQATISMFTGAAKALELPFPANIAAMAAVLAKGAAFVASIKSTAVPKYKMGGVGIVPGGLGGGDKVPFHAMLEPGEEVSIKSNSERGSSAVTNVLVNLRSVAFSRDREMLRDLIEGINGMTADGYRLQVSPA